jgi:6-phosphogluconolactonase (cycloisomerase 2 family)
MGVGGRRIGTFVVAWLVGVCLTVGVAQAAQPLGALTELSGTTGCFTFNGASEDGAGTCSQARGLAEGESAIVSPDGKNVYVGSYRDTSPVVEPGFAVFSRNSSTGALTQLAGTAGCLTPDGASTAGAGTCTKARGLISNDGDGHDIAFSSDGRWAYIAAQNNVSGHGAVLIFQRDPATGALTQAAGTAGCITTDGASQDGAGMCQTDATLSEPQGVAMSSDDRFLYVTDYGTTNRIHVFARNTTTGALTDVQCLSEAVAPSGCTTGRTLGDSEYLTLSPNGRYAYSGDYFTGMSIFDRNPSSGLLTQKAGTAGCITTDGKDDAGNSTCAVGRQVKGNYPVLVSPNGTTLYNIDGSEGGFSVFHINADGTLSQLSGAAGCVTIDGKDSTGATTCTTARAVEDVYGGALSPDGGSLYVSNNSTPGGLAIFSLDQSTGVATQLSGLEGCITSDGSSNAVAGQCTDGHALSEGYGMSVSPDGNSVYQATDDTGRASGVAVFARETAPSCQSTSATTAAGRAVSVSLHCADADGDAVTRTIASGPSHGSLSAINNAAGTVTYTPAAGFSGTDSFSFAASDGVNRGADATATITVAPLPAISGLHVSPSKFSLAGRLVNGHCVKPTKKNAHDKSCRRSIKLRFSYKLNVADKVTFTLKREASGRKVGHRCVKPTRTNRKDRVCTLLVSVHGKLVKSGKRGANHFIFNGKIGGHTLGPGTYQLTATPKGGKAKKVTFRIVP